MHVQEIVIGKFRHLKNVRLGPYAQPGAVSDLFALAGPNGGGKSSILEIIGYSLSQLWSLSWGLQRSFSDSGFEVRLAITNEERRLILESLSGSVTAGREGVLEVVRQGSYWRGFNFPEGEYAKQAPLFNEVHNIVLSVLRNKYQRPPGFFLKSDRSYGAISFNRNRLFEYQSMIAPQYTWNYAFSTSSEQYRDIFEYLVQSRYHYLRDLGLFHDKQSNGLTPGERPDDPLVKYNALFKELFPNHTLESDDQDIPHDLFVKLPSGERIAFHDMSSGEREVFFILAFFLRQDVTSAVVIIDEPEMHLHPELARMLVRTMQSIKPDNQIWVATHNPEILDEAGPDRTILVSRDPITREAKVISGFDDKSSTVPLRNLFGFSGYIGVGRALVFLEGTDLSSDRKIFSRLFPKQGRYIRFVPSGTVSNLARINAAVLSILETGLGWMNYFVVRDRDYLSDELSEQMRAKGGQKLFILKRYHIENYLLVSEAISQVESDIYSRQSSPSHVDRELHAAAKQLSAEFLRDMISYRLNLAFQSEDFSIPRLFEGEGLYHSDGAVRAEVISSLTSRFEQKAAEVKEGLSRRVGAEAVKSVVEECLASIENAMSSDGWRSILPGRRILEAYAKRTGLGDARVFQASIVRELSNHADRVDKDLSEIVAKIGAM